MASHSEGHVPFDVLARSLLQTSRTRNYVRALNWYGGQCSFMTTRARSLVIRSESLQEPSEAITLLGFKSRNGSLLMRICPGSVLRVPECLPLCVAVPIMLQVRRSVGSGAVAGGSAELRNRLAIAVIGKVLHRGPRLVAGARCFVGAHGSAYLSQLLGCALISMHVFSDGIAFLMTFGSF